MKLIKSLILTFASVNADSYWLPWANEGGAGRNHGDLSLCSKNADGTNKNYITATCSSGRKLHCESKLGKDASHGFKCEVDDTVEGQCNTDKKQVVVTDDTENKCRAIYGSFGEHVTCEKNEIMVGMCASGRYKNCLDGKASHLALCCQYEVKNRMPVLDGRFPLHCETFTTEGSGENCGWRYGKYGEYVHCENGQAAKGMCASGMYRDCQINSDRQYPGRDPYWWSGKWYNYNAIYCCDI